MKGIQSDEAGTKREEGEKGKDEGQATERPTIPLLQTHFLIRQHDD